MIGRTGSMLLLIARPLAQRSNTIRGRKNCLKGDKQRLEPRRFKYFDLKKGFLSNKSL